MEKLPNYERKFLSRASTPAEFMRVLPALMRASYFQL